MWKFSCGSVFLVALTFSVLTYVSCSVSDNQPEERAEGVAEGTVFTPKTIGPSDAHLDPPEHYVHKRSAENYYYYRRERTSKKVPTCTEKYAKLSGHTMCMVDRPNLIQTGLKPGAARFILKEHNRYRGIVEPPATDLPKMVWNRELARVAQKWANQCLLAHDKVRIIPEFEQFVGQNVAAGQKSWKEALKAWYDEIKLFRYGEDPKKYIGKDYLIKVGHFTQMVTNGTVMVGCGQASCSNNIYTRFFVCNYLAGQSQLTHPYTRGQRCSKCPNNCKDGVCDCGGKFCRHLGRLDVNTCQCTCTDLYRGDTCSQIVCPPADKARCKQQWNRSHCKKYVNVPVECPYMCGKCSNKDKKIFAAVPRGKAIKSYGRDYVKTKQGCWFYGKRPSLAKCSTLGEGGADKPYACASSGGKFDCDACHKYFNVPFEYCPVMCGLCDGPCNGKTCLNNGDLDRKTCNCKCSKPFYGSLCEKVKCPKADPYQCESIPPSACKKYYNVPGMCPRTCGLCNQTLTSVKTS